MITPMEWLNYHHLLYFCVVGREGTVARASEVLGRSQPTISTQIHELEESLGEKLFKRAGRRLVLTDVGRRVFRYAEEIYSLGKELMDSVNGRPTGRPLQLVVGIADVLPKLMTRRLLEPALRLPDGVRLVCVEDRPERLLANLALHELDVVLSDSPATPEVNVRVFSHLLGECGVTFFGARRHAALRRGFPRSLNGAPLLVPTKNTTLRRNLEVWFEELDIRPLIVGEFQDSALLMVFGQTGEGVFAAPSVIEREVTKEFRTPVIGRTKKLRERVYAISVERKIEHPAVVAISDAARGKIFGQLTDVPSYAGLLRHVLAE